VNYVVEYHPAVEPVRCTLPRDALLALGDLECRLRGDPWSVGVRMSGGLKDTLEAPLGRHGFATYVVQDERCTVSVIHLTWTG